MGRSKKHPRYNILSCRVSDDLRDCITRGLEGRTIQEYLHSAIEDKLISDRQGRIDELLRKPA